MLSLFGRQITAMLSGPMGRVMALNGRTAPCFLDDETTVIEDGTGAMVTRRTRSAIIKTGSLSGLADGISVTVDGTSYRVSGPLLTMDDGMLTRVLLARADS